MHGPNAETRWHRSSSEITSRLRPDFVQPLSACDFRPNGSGRLKKRLFRQLPICLSLRSARHGPLFRCRELCLRIIKPLLRLFPGCLPFYLRRFVVPSILLGGDRCLVILEIRTPGQVPLSAAIRVSSACQSSSISANTAVFPSARRVVASRTKPAPEL